MTGFSHAQHQQKGVKMEYWKSKLKHILHSTQFCGICLSADNLVNTISDQYEIVVDETSHSRTLADILDVVFQEASNLASSQICNSCTKKLIESYIFIQQAQETLNIVNSCLNELINKTCYIHNNILNKDHDNSSLYNVIIPLDKNNFKNVVNYQHKTEEISKVEKRMIHSSKRRFKCLMCNIVLPSYKAWSIHETNTHKHKCKRCFKTFKSQKCMIKHFKSHFRSKCKICLRIVQDGRLLEHLKEYHEHSSRLCSMCNIAFYSVKDIEAHKQEWHYSDASKCLTCLKSCSEAELLSHQCKFGCSVCAKAPCVHHKYLMCYRQQILNGALRAKCLDCQYLCRSKEAILAHVNIRHLNRHPCHNCGETFNSQSNLNIHIRNCYKNGRICQYCDVEFTNQRIYESHIKDCGSNNRHEKKQRSVPLYSSKGDTKFIREKQDIFPCGLCNKIYLNDATRKRHMIQKHSRQQKNKVVILDCVVCQEKCATKAELIHHMKTHGPDVKYKCRICDAQYETIRQFKAHNRKHVGPFAICEVCGKEMRQILLKKHMTTHSDSVVTCETCGKSFQNTALLKYHQKVHLESVPCPKCDKLINPAKLRRHYKNHIIQEDPDLKANTKQTPNLNCELCEYKTWNNILLECHMNRHHLKIKPYICHICSKAFIGKHLLKKHIDTHTMKKTVMCMICTKKFANAACLKMHLRLHTGERPFTCEICGDRFRSSSILNVHKLKKHSDKNSSCPICQNKFHTVRDLRRHIIKVHWKEKDKKFNPRELKGLSEEHYHLFHDGRRVKVDEEDLEFYLS